VTSQVKASHGEIASRLIDRLPPGVFAHAARAAVIHHDYLSLEGMLPGVKFYAVAQGPDSWILTGICEDGSIVTWGVGA
jgi:hypothetical protein